MQTAVELLIELLAHNNILDHKKLSSNERLYNLYKRLVEQAKEMERQQIVDAVNKFALGSDEVVRIILKKYNLLNTGEQYYNETYKK